MVGWAWGLIAGGCIVFLLVFVLFLRLYKGKKNTYALRRAASSGASSKNLIHSNKSETYSPVFDWRDYPALMSEALDKGWASFSLMTYRKHHQVEFAWEIANGTEHMQVIRLKVRNELMQLFVSALPLPGPFLGPYSFPQKAYFEISISPGSAQEENSQNKLLLNKNSIEFDRCNPIVRSKRIATETAGGSETFTAAIGLLSKANCTLGDVGSIGFYSNGQTLINGKTHISENYKQTPWPLRDEITVGCGFNPKQRNVFFTLNGEIQCELKCEESYSVPVHVAYGCNYDSTAILNYGQAAFEYAPENVNRISDPGNHMPVVRRSSFRYDSGDLFSVSSNPGSQDFRRPPASEAESELFEIVLDADGNEKVVDR